jgi:hypothetical protein
MAKNTTGDFIKSVFPTLVNKDDKVFMALFANQNETGTVEKIFNELEKTRDVWCNNSNVYNQSGEMLEKALSYFTFIHRLPGESDESLKARIELLFYRNGDIIWGDRWDIVGIFKKYFRTDLVFIVNNTNKNDENLLLDGDFEEMNAWALETCTYDPMAAFNAKQGILFDSAGGTCSQNAGMEANSTYYLHFFLNGIIDVELQDNNGRYWNKNEGEFGEWQADPAAGRFSADKWDAESIFFITDEMVDSVAVNFIGVNDTAAWLDYARLFKKGNYSSFTLIVDFKKSYSKETLGMAPGLNDPMNLDYSHMSYIEYSHILGNEGLSLVSVYQDLLEIVRPGGITSYIEILTRD